MLRPLLAALVMCGCTSAPASQPSAQIELGTGGPNARAESNGIVVEFWLDRTEVAAGDVVLALVRLSNQGTIAVEREGNMCGVGPARMSVEQNTAAAAVPAGIEWPGRAAVFKQALINEAGLGAHRDLGSFSDPTLWNTNILCTLAGRRESFGPGETDQMALAWRAKAQDGSILVPGPATIRANFEGPEWGRNPAPVIKVVAEAQIEVVGSGESQAVGLTLVDYVDAALSVNEFRDWVNSTPPGTTVEPRFHFWPTDEGNWPGRSPYTEMNPRPVVEVTAVRPEVEQVLGVVIDRVTGNFVALRRDFGE